MVRHGAGNLHIYRHFAGRNPVRPQRGGHPFPGPGLREAGDRLRRDSRYGGSAPVGPACRGRRGRGRGGHAPSTRADWIWVKPWSVYRGETGRGRTMITKRIIPCLDVKDGRVVKGVSFVNLKDAGDPVELAALYDREGADELVFLDISASQEGRGTMVDVVREAAAETEHPLHRGRGDFFSGGHVPPSPRRRGQGVDQHRRRPPSGTGGGRGAPLRQSMHRGGHRRPLGSRRGRTGSSTPTEAAGPPTGWRWTGRRKWWNGEPGRSSSPAWTRTGKRAGLTWS